MKNIILIMGILMVNLSGCSKASTDFNTSGDDGWDYQKNKNNLTVMSYNIRHCSPYLGSGVPSPAEVGNVAKVLKDKNADVVLLQEVDSMTTRALNIDQTKELAKRAGYKYHKFFKQKDYQGGAYGAAILSKYEMKNIINHPLPKMIDGQTIKGSNILGSAKIVFAGKDIYIATMHLSVTESERLKQFPKYLECLEPFAHKLIIIGGDFNSRPTDASITMLETNGFTRTNKDPNKFTIPSDKPNRELDYIAYKPSTAVEVVSHTVFTGINASDHLPIVSVLKIK